MNFKGPKFFTDEEAKRMAANSGLTSEYLLRRHTRIRSRNFEPVEAIVDLSSMFVLASYPAASRNQSPLLAGVFHQKPTRKGR